MFPKTSLVLLATFLTVFAPADALWPQPRALQTGSTALRLSSSFDISLSSSIHNAPADLQAAVQDAKQFIKTDTLERLVVGRGSADAAAVAKAKTLSKLTLTLGKGATVHPITSEAQKAPEDRNEAYTLTVPADGSSATISANSTLGLYRGLTTFTQLFFSHDSTTYLLNAPVDIEDSPAYVSRQSDSCEAVC